MKAYPWLALPWLVLCLLLAESGHALDPDLQYFQYQYVEAPAHAGLGHGVHAMVQDNDGFLWLATDRGLLRFDGHDSRLFRAIDHAGLISNKITDLWITREGDLLIASEQGMSRYRDHQFESIVGGNKWSAYIRAMAQTDAGTIWLGSARGLFRWQDNELGPTHTERINGVSALYARGNTLFVGGNGAVYRVDGQTVVPISLPGALSGATVTDLTLYNDQIWGITKAGMFSLEDGVAIHAQHPQLQGLVAEGLLADSDGSLWFYGQTSLGRFVPDGSLEIVDATSDEFGLGAEVSELLEDRDGRLWVASALYALSARMDAPVRRISYGEGLLSATIQAVSTDADGHILLATAAGINRLNGKDIEVVLQTDALAATPARAMVTDSADRLMIGTSKGLVRYDPTRQALVNVENIDPVPVNALVSDPNHPDTIWIGTDLGLQKWQDGQVSSLPAVRGVAVESLFFDRRGTLWIGTETGLVSMGDTTLTLHASEIPATLDAVLDIVQLGNGQIMASTRNHGLIVRTPDGWHQYTERQGLPKASIIGLELHGDDVWIVSTAGLFRVDARQIYAGKTNLDVKAIISLENYRAMHVDLCCSGNNGFAVTSNHDRLFVTTRDGVITLNMNEADALPVAPEPYIKAITLDDQATRRYDGAPVTLKGKHHRLRIDYSALSLAQDGRLTFRYRLRGQSDEWMPVEQARTVHLTHLPPGEFSFELQASVTPDIWVGSSVPLAIRRTPGITETLAFRAALWLASVGLVVSLFWLRLAVARRRHRVLESRIREHTKTLRSVNAQLESRNQDLRRASETDALTGLLNRRYFDVRQSKNELNEELDASLSDQGVLIMIDIDHFKRVNDTFGHAAGDAVLRQFADVLRAVTRQSDVVARWGGEEFMMLCRCQENHAPVLLERIVDAVRSHAFILDNGDHINIHASLGAVLYPLWPGRSMDDRLGVLLELADAALYRVKSCGRDGWALLSGATPPHKHVRIKRAGPLLSALIADNHLTWTASRPNIEPDQMRCATQTG